MQVVRLRRGWRVQLTDNEYEMLCYAVNAGLGAIGLYHLDDRLPYKVRKVLHGDKHGQSRWALPDGPLVPDEDRKGTPKRKYRRRTLLVPDENPLGTDLPGDVDAGESHESMKSGGPDAA